MRGPVASGDHPGRPRGTGRWVRRAHRQACGQAAAGLWLATLLATVDAGLAPV